MAHDNGNSKGSLALTHDDLKKFVRRFRVEPGKTVSLKHDFDPNDSAGFDKPENADELLREGVELLAEYQDKLYAENSRALLIILQAMDAAGKDGVIKHVMSGLNPQGCMVFSFKAPSAEELDHDYLWRSFKALPERGRIGIFNRSYYEETLVVRVHPAFLAAQRLPPEPSGKDLWKARFEQINGFEKYLVENGIEVIKLFLNVSKEEQRERFLERIDRPEKNWKLSPSDAQERAFWDDYQAAFEDVFNHTSTEWAPWYVLPADKKWFTRIAAAAIIADKLMAMDPQYPTVTDEQRQELLKTRALLEAEVGAEPRLDLPPVAHPASANGADPDPKKGKKKKDKKAKAKKG